MGLLVESMTLEVVCAVVIVLWLYIYISITQQYTYWKKKGVPHVQPIFPFGTHKNVHLGKLNLGQMYKKYYNQFKGERYFGCYDIRRPLLVVKDPELLKHIMTKDFNYFTNRFSFSINEIDYINRNLFTMQGKKWKEMRLKLTPTFTIGRIKEMVMLMKNCSELLNKHVDESLVNEDIIDITDVLGRFSMQIIASCGFGLEVDSLNNKNCDFFSYGRKIFQTNVSSVIKQIASISFPLLTKLLTIRLVNKDISDFFTRIVRDTVEYRETNNVIRNDFLQLLIKMRQNTNGNPANKNIEQQEIISSDETGLTIEEITAQCFTFFLAGFETSSSLMSFCLYELAYNPEIQENLHREIREVLGRHEEQITYYALQEMPYMDKVINETLRRYPLGAALNRTCTETYKVPDSDLVLEKGQRIAIPVFAIHHDPEHYPDPYKFDPERFSPDKVKERHAFLYLPFGEGPRMCIGMRFGLMQTKVGLATMIRNFKFDLAPTTQIPVTINKRSFVTQSEKPILLSVTRR